jgi:hypothetical protein
MKQLVIAVDFDGTLCEYAFPKIGNQTEQQKNLLDLLIALKQKGHYLILWTNRGDTDELKCLSEAIEWCKNQGLEFDQVNNNNPEREANKKSGYSRKILADYYIDDKCLEFGNVLARTKTLEFLSNL